MMTTLWAAVGTLILTLIGVDVAKNPQSYRNIGLRISDGCRVLWFWPMHYRAARDNVPRHSLAERLNTKPDFMRTWHLS